MKIKLKDIMNVIDSVPNWNVDCPFKMELKEKLHKFKPNPKEKER